MGEILNSYRKRTPPFWFTENETCYAIGRGDKEIFYTKGKTDYDKLMAATAVAMLNKGRISGNY